MDAKLNFAVVGAFVLVLGAALVGGVLWLSSGKSYHKAYETYLVYMTESVAGLDPDAPVRYRGVQIGVVRRIALAPGNVEQVLLTLDIERGTPVKQDTVAILRTQGLTGIGHIELTGGTRASSSLAALPGNDYPVIQTGPSLMVRLDAAVSSLLANLNRSSESLNLLLEEGNRAALKELLANINSLSRTLSTRSGVIDSGVVNAAKTMENTARLTAELPQLIERFRKSADTFDGMSEQVKRASVDVAGTVREVGADVRGFTGETLPEARALLAELRELGASLQRLSDQIERNPAMLLYGRPVSKPGPGE